MNNKIYKWIALILFIVSGVYLGLRMNNYSFIKLYYADDTGEYLKVENRRIHDVTQEHLPDTIIRELLRGPKSKDLTRIIPESTYFLPIKKDSPRIVVKDGCAFVNFSNDIITDFIGGSMNEVLLIGSIVNSLTELDYINSVQILVDGKIVNSLGGHVDTKMPLSEMPYLIDP